MGISFTTSAEKRAGTTTGGIDEQESKQLFLEKCYEKAQLMGTEMDRKEFWEIAEMLTDTAKKQIACASKKDQEW